MSKIAKGVKKVFRGVKKFVKKIAKPALIAGAIFLGAGLIAGGFSGFTGFMASGGGGIGGFFSAVGNTMAVGFQSTMGTLGLSAGVSPTLAAKAGYTAAGAPIISAGTTLGTGALAQTLGLSTGPATVGADLFATQKVALASKPLSAEAVKAAATKVGMTGPASGILGMTKGAVSGMGGLGQVAAFAGISKGFEAYMASEAAEKERKQFMKSGVFGVARGEKYGQAFGPEEIYAAASTVPGTSAYAQQQAGMSSPYPETQQTPSSIQQPLPTGQSLIGQTYEEGERQNPAQFAMQPNYLNPYQMQPAYARPLLG